MDFSASNTQLWHAFIQLCYLSTTILLANILRRKISMLSKTLLPTSVIAGFMLLAFREFHILPIDQQFMESLVYHMTAIGFIALSLRVNDFKDYNEEKGINSPGAKSGFVIVSSYLIQAIVGLLITTGLAYTVMPGLFKASGIILALGFGQGPGQANNVGNIYEGMGFVGGASFGLAVAAIGFLWACFGGVAYLAYLVSKGKVDLLGRITPSGMTSEQIESPEEVPLTEAVDKFTIQVTLVFMVYLVTYLLSIVLTRGIVNAEFLGTLKNTLVPLVWGFNFLIGSMLATAFAALFLKLRKSGIMTHQYQNNYMLNRISGTAFDIMITAALCSISLGDVKMLWLPLLLITTVGGIVTFIYLIFISKHVYKNYKYEGFFSMYGMMTGTVSTGVMLLREIDPSFKTPAANNLVIGSTSAILLGFPLLVLIGLAPRSTEMLFLSILIMAVYLILLNVFILKDEIFKKKIKGKKMN
jgi:ESS family glutamate:Na+ symporter